MAFKFVAERTVSFPGDIYLVDGLTGTGKTLITKLLATASNCHIPQFNFYLEQICILNSFKKIDEQTSKVLVNMMIDQKRYDNSISREVNFRMFDLSSILRSRKRFEYLKKLIAEDGGVAENKLMKVPKNLIFITHQLLDTSEIIRKSTKAQCYQIICTRHPIYLFHHWRSYIKLFGNSPRDFTLWQKFHNSELPWFIESKSLWNTGNYDEKTIIAISDLTDRLLKYHNLMRNQEQIFFLEFEKLVLGRINIYQSLSRIGFNFPSSFNSVLRKEKVPRKHLNEGKNRKIYQRYHANMLNNFSDHKSDYMQLRSVILKRVRKKYGTIFEKTIEKYEKNFELWF